MTKQILALPDISKARLPATYEAAKTALAECTRVDECQSWANKAEAMASYAKQSRDDTLRKMADRIQARAINRCGELLKLEQAKLGRFEHSGRPRKNVDASAPITIRAMADAAGLSERQRKTALRVASIPREEFERQVESDDPPTVTKLAEQGKRSLVELGSSKPKDFAHATQAIAQLRRFAEFAMEHDPVSVASGVTKSEAKAVRDHVAVIDSWLDRFVISIGG